MIVNCTFSLSAKDVFKDASESGRNCTKFQIQYFSELLCQETEKKSDKNISTPL